MALEKDILVSQEQQFNEVIDIILQHKSRASVAVNTENLLLAWHVGAYVSAKLNSEEWGSKVVSQLSQFIRSHRPELKGYGRSSIYNMVMFYDEYSSEAFHKVATQYIPKLIVQSPLGQLEGEGLDSEIYDISMKREIVQSLIGQFSNILTLTTLTNHGIILSNCRSNEERLFYILYAHKERLGSRELLRCISNHTFETLVSKKDNLSKGMLEAYPNAPYIFKDKVYVDFLGLPKKHSESRLRKGILEHMKEFILELGKDFLFVDQEYCLNVGSSTFKADLLFFHRGLQALVAVELKKTKFHPRDLGQLEFYLEALDRDVKRTNENPSIGIILCPEADHVVVEYAMSRSMSPTLIAQYKRVLIPQETMTEQLKEYCQYLLENK